MPDLKCIQCRFSLPQDDMVSLCRRYPPVLNIATQQWQFPVMVHREGWCGEFKIKPKVKVV